MQHSPSRKQFANLQEGERRNFRRYEASLSLKFWYSNTIDRWHKGRGTNLSLEGLQLETTMELHPESTLLFDLTSFVQSPVDAALIAGHVIWGKRIKENLYQYGVTFLMIEDQVDEVLKEKDRDRNVITEVLRRLIVGEKSRHPKKPC